MGAMSQYQPSSSILRYDISRLRQRISVYEIVREDDGAGGTTREDTLIKTVSAYIAPVKAKEIMQGAQNEERITHWGFIRFNEKFKAGQTIKHRGKELFIVSITDPTQLKEWQDLQLREGGPV